ncbi:MAG: hypothetical protein IKT56_05980 [Clostridia bacterium]|nr:hypothetical protein [Clostridia bacterium]
MIESYSHSGEDFKAVLTYEGWKIGLLRKSERFSTEGIWERHTMTDEAFVLLLGAATLFAKDESGNIEKVEMKNDVLYNVPKGVWHHIIVADEDTTVLVVENSNTSALNTEKILPA